MSTFIKGDVNVLSIHDGTIWRPIACLTSNTLSETVGIIETQTKCEPGETLKQAGSHSYELSCEGNYIDTTSAGAEVTKASHDYLRSFMDSKASFYWKLATGLTDTAAYYGTAILSSLETTAAAGDEFTTFSASLAGSGAIVSVDPS